MKKLTIKTKDRVVSAEFHNDETLDEVLLTVEGLIRALGYCFDGHLEIVEDDRITCKG